MSGIQQHSVTIASGTTLSPFVNVAGQLVVGLSVGTVASTAATFTATFEPPQSPKGGSFEAQSFRTLKDKTGATITVVIASNQQVDIDPPLKSIHQLKIVNNVAASGDETWTVITRPQQ